MRDLERQNASVARKMKEIPYEKWTQAWDGGRRYGHMTTNLVECVNGVLKKSRHLPITALVKCTYYKLGTMFAKRGKEAQDAIRNGHAFTEDCTRQLNASHRRAPQLTVENFSRNQLTASVKGPYTNKQGRTVIKKFKVNIEERWCDCGEFQANRFPCEHVVAVCLAAYVDYKQYVDDLYRNETLLRAYEAEFDVLRHQDYWCDVADFELLPDPRRRRDPKGRPQSRRIRNDMDEIEESHPKLCKICWQPGHDSRKCPKRTDGASSSRS